MGYYDEEVQKPKRQRPHRPWITALSSAIIGGLIVTLMIPGLAQLNLLPYDITPKQTQQQQQSQSTEVAGQPTVQQPVQLNVSSGVIDAVEKVSDAIVGVVRFQEQADFFSRSVEQVESGSGSGVIYEINGDKAYIVTNYHVIENAKKVEVSLANGERVEATLKGADQLSDLAVLEIDAEHVDTVAEFGDSDTIRAGEPAIAIGNPLGLDFSRTVTQGIISAKERSVAVPNNNWEINVIQTDAAINVGNSGGALLNIDGQVIGINSMKIASSGVEGIGFAIPINDVIPIIHDLVQNGEVQRPFLGVGIIDLASIDSSHWQNTLKLPENVTQGIVIRELEPFGPAAQAGLQELDVIVALDDQAVNNSMELRKYLFNKKSIGETVKVKVYRDGLPQTVDVELAKSSSQSTGQGR